MKDLFSLLGFKPGMKPMEVIGRIVFLAQAAYSAVGHFRDKTTGATDTSSQPAE